MCTQKPIETDEEFAKRAGYRVVQSDILARASFARTWMVVAPREKVDVDQLKRRPDSRQRFVKVEDAWEVAAIRARRAGKKGGNR